MLEYEMNEKNEDIQTDLKIEKKIKFRNRKFVVVGLLCIGLLGSIGTGIGFFYWNHTTADEETVNAFTNQQENGAIISGTGVTTIGIDDVYFVPDYLEEDLIIEEVYLSQNQTIESGSKIFKVTEESLEKVKESLEDTLLETELAYRTGVIEFEQSKIEAKYAYEKTVNNSSYAKQEYEDTVATLDLNLEAAKQSVSDLETQVQELSNRITNLSYYSELGLDNLQTIYDSNLLLLQTKADEWQIPYSMFTTNGVKSNQGIDQWELTTLTLLYSELEENLNELEAAQELYEDFEITKLQQLDKLQIQLTKAKLNQTQAEKNYESGIEDANTLYQTSLIDQQLAQSVYDTEIEKATEDFETLEISYRDAKENLEEFLDLLGDGFYYTQEEGVILRIMINPEDKLSDNSLLFSFRNSKEVTVSVSIDQSKIDQIQVGSDATVMIDNKQYQATVSSINPITQSTSKTNITYDVIITLEVTDVDIEANQTATVIIQGEDN